MRLHSSQEKGVLQKLDREWIFLLKEAKKIGISKREIRNFLQRDHTDVK